MYFNEQFRNCVKKVRHTRYLQIHTTTTIYVRSHQQTSKTISQREPSQRDRTRSYHPYLFATPVLFLGVPREAKRKRKGGGGGHIKSTFSPCSPVPQATIYTANLRLIEKRRREIQSPSFPGRRRRQPISSIGRSVGGRLGVIQLISQFHSPRGLQGVEAGQAETRKLITNTIVQLESQEMRGNHSLRDSVLFFVCSDCVRIWVSVSRVLRWAKLGVCLCEGETGNKHPYQKLRRSSRKRKGEEKSK